MACQSICFIRIIRSRDFSIQRVTEKVINKAHGYKCNTQGITKIVTNFPVTTGQVIKKLKHSFGEDQPGLHNQQAGGNKRNRRIWGTWGGGVGAMQNLLRNVSGEGNQEGEGGIKGVSPT